MQLHASRVTMKNQQQTILVASAWFGSQYLPKRPFLATTTANLLRLAVVVIIVVCIAKCLIYVTFSCLIHKTEPNSGRTPFTGTSLTHCDG